MRNHHTPHFFVCFFFFPFGKKIPEEHLWAQWWKLLFCESPQICPLFPALFQQPEMLEDSHMSCPAWPNYGAFVLNLSNPFLMPFCACCLPLGQWVSAVHCLMRSFTVYEWRIFSIKDIWEWDLLGSLTSNDQQCRMKLLSLCSGLHGKKHHIKFYHVFNGNEMIKLG